MNQENVVIVTFTLSEILQKFNIKVERVTRSHIENALSWYSGDDKLVVEIKQ